MINKKLFSRKIFDGIEIFSQKEIEGKLRKLLELKYEISKKIHKHPYPDEIPQLKKILVKYDTAISELKKVLPPHALVDSIGMPYVRLEGGKFEMGSNGFKDNPPHEVILSPFEIAKTLVTQKQWRDLMGDELKAKYTSKYLHKNADDHPMESISWFDSINYCKALSLRANDVDEIVKEKIKNMSAEDYLKFALENHLERLYRLPTEAEWEFAAKAGKNYKYGTFDGKKPTSETAVWNIPDAEGTNSVTSFKPNLFGLHDMAGNLWQWTASGYSKDFYEREKSYYNPVGPEKSDRIVLRGGSFFEDNHAMYQTVFRHAYEAKIRICFNGFRPVRYIE